MPASKRKRDDATNDVVLKVKHMEDGFAAPLIATSKTSRIPSTLHFTTYTRPHKNHNDTTLMIHSSSHPSLDFIGTETHTQGPEGEMQDYVAIFDPTTGTLECYPARTMELRTVLRSELDDVRAGESNLSDSLTAREQRAKLTEAYGSKKAKKQQQTLASNVISDRTARETTPGGTEKKESLDNVQSALLASVAEKTKDMPDQQSRDEMIDAAKPRPKHNPAATKKAEVYPLAHLCPASTFGLLLVRDWEEKLEAQDDVRVMSKHVGTRLQRYRSSVVKLRVLRFLLHLIEFKAGLVSMGKKGFKVPKRDSLAKKVTAPEGLLGKILASFTQGDVLSQWDIDYLITHICCLALFIDDWATDTADLMVDLGVDQTTINRYFREVGCKVGQPSDADRVTLGISKADASQHKIARLSFPVEFPKARMVRARGRR